MRAIEVPGLPKPLSVLVLGTMNMKPEDKESAFELLDTYSSSGGTALDTAHVYGGGLSEQALGLWMQARGNRANMVVITKGCHPLPGGPPRVTPEAIRRDIGESLLRLQTDHVDLYLLHRDDETVPVGPIIEALNGEIAGGRISAFGASNWRAERIDEANAYVVSNRLRGFSASSINMSLAEPHKQIWDGCLSMDARTLSWHAVTRLPLLAWSAQARGLFSPRYESGEPWRQELLELYDTPSNRGRLERARSLASRRGATANRVALAWVLARNFPVAAVIGPRNAAQLADSLAALEIRFNPEEMSFLAGNR